MKKNDNTIGKGRICYTVGGKDFDFTKSTQDTTPTEWAKDFDEFIYHHNRKPEIEKFGITIEEQKELHNIVAQVLDQQRTELAHKTEDGYCCACDYDIAVMEEEIEKRVARQIKIQRTELLEQVNSEPVSEHAVLRYCERVLNIDIEDIKEQLKEIGSFFIEKMEDGIVKTKIDGKSFTIKISNGKVVTIIKNKKIIKL